MRKILIITILLTMFISSTAQAEEPQTLGEALKVANKELEPICNTENYFEKNNISGKPIKEEMWSGRSLFVYGSPFKFDNATGHNRYLGYTLMDEAYTNVLFRHDAWGGGTINDRHWIPIPWDEKKVKMSLIKMGEKPIRKNSFRNREEYRSSIIRGLQYYADNGNGPPIPFVPDDGMEWEKYVHVLQPPTKYTWGMGRMWHQKANGSIWYITIPMAPTLEPATGVGPVTIDLSTQLDVDSFKDVEPGDKVTSTVTYTLNNEHSQPETAWLRLHHVVSSTGEFPITLEPINPADTLDANGHIEFQPGESKTYKYTFTVQDKPSKIVSRINPISTDQDKDWSNNRDEATIVAKKNNLWVEILDHSDDVVEGGTATVSARIHNDLGELLTTRLVWKVDGKIVKDNQNFDLIGQIEDSITFNASSGNSNVTVEVNPDRDRPSNEVAYDDNKASVTVTAVPSEAEFEGSVEIIAPDVWEPLKPLPFTVKVSDYLPYGRRSHSHGERGRHSHRYSKSYNINVSTSGEGKLTIEWNPFDPTGGYQKTKPVTKSWGDSFTKSSGSYSKTYNYTFPATGMRGMSESYVVLEASASRAGSAKKVVKITPAPVKTPNLKLTQ
ncbi:MAG: hypothetical protein FH758_04035 [Firmicutes bacterium]|nr:hypothetical protein [Bacillota bacterium]